MLHHNVRLANSHALCQWIGKKCFANRLAKVDWGSKSTEEIP